MQKRNRHRIARRQAEAIERQAAYDALSTEEKIAKAEKAPGESKKELRRLRNA
jgi:hypothetical protein